MDELAAVVDDVRLALIHLGYCIKGRSIGVRRIMIDLYKVYYDGEYFGLWDSNRKTFVE